MMFLMFLSRVRPVLSGFFGSMRHSQDALETLTESL